MTKKYILSLSGGKDSTIALWIVVEKNYPLDVVLCNRMAFEEPEMYDHLKKLDDYLFDKKGIRINFIENEKSIEKFMSGIVTRGKNKGIIRGFPLKGLGFCWISRDWKIIPLERFTKKYEKDNNCVVHTYKGFVIDEPNKGRLLKIKQYRAGLLINESYPLVDYAYTEEMCRAKLKEVGLDSPVHFMQNRSGCWFCQKSRKKARLEAINRFPWRLEKIKEWIKLSRREIYPDLTLKEIEEYCNK